MHARQGQHWNYPFALLDSPHWPGTTLSSCWVSSPLLLLCPPNCALTLLLQIPSLQPSDAFAQFSLQNSCLSWGSSCPHIIPTPLICGPFLICMAQWSTISVTLPAPLFRALPSHVIPSLLYPLEAPSHIIHSTVLEHRPRMGTSAMSNDPTIYLEDSHPTVQKSISFLFIHLQVYRSPPSTHMPHLSSTPISSCVLEELALFTPKATLPLSPS